MIPRILATITVVSHLLALASAKPSVYIIRHGEKPSDGGNTLSAQGVQRSQCLVNVFGRASEYGIGYILAQKPKSNGAEQRPFDTVTPLAKSLGLKIDTECHRDDSTCVTDAVKNYKGAGNILICWEHHELTNIIAELGDQSAPTYPDDRFDLIWTEAADFKSIANEQSQCCPGLDNC